MNTFFNINYWNLKYNVLSQYLIIFCLTFFGFYLYKYYQKYRRFYELISEIPGPPSLPLIGNAYLFIGNVANITKKLYKLKDLYKSTFKIKLGPKVFVGITKPEDIAILLNHSLEKGDILAKFGYPWFGNCLLVANVPRWKYNRKIIVTTFNPKILEGFLQTFIKQSKILVKCLEKELGKDEFDFYPYATRASLDMICGTAMGISTNAQTEDSEYLEAVKNQLHIITCRAYKFWLHSDFIFNFTALAKQQKKNIKIIQEFKEKVIKEKQNILKKQREQNEINKIKGECEIEKNNENNLKSNFDENNNNNDVKLKKNPERKAFLDLLLEIHEKDPLFNDVVLREEVDVLLLGGYETTSTTNGFSLLVLGNCPKIQQKICDELYDIFGDSDRSVEMEDLNKMFYLEMFIKEVLRMFPTLPFLLRKTTEEVKLESLTLPADLTCFIPTMSLHHDESIWETPDLFIPERFLPSEISKRHPYSYIPFSAGPRNCIGYKYAMIAMKTILSTILRAYVIKTDLKLEKIKFKLEATLKTTQGFPIKIEKRFKLKNLDDS